MRKTRIRPVRPNERQLVSIEIIKQDHVNVTRQEVKMKGKCAILKLVTGNAYRMSLYSIGPMGGITLLKGPPATPNSAQQDTIDHLRNTAVKDHCTGSLVIMSEKLILTNHLAKWRVTIGTHYIRKADHIKLSFDIKKNGILC